MLGGGSSLNSAGTSTFSGTSTSFGFSFVGSFSTDVCSALISIMSFLMLMLFAAVSQGFEVLKVCCKRFWVSLLLLKNPSQEVNFFSQS
jgi:hypothetical protein